MPNDTANRTALARTYRPRRFAEMATQEHVSETLRAAVARGRTAHAYLFCGPRGVGKTTAARVLAMALNCPDRTDDGEPCAVCDSCLKIWSGKTSLDVVEIDAASNRGVDDARDLRERAMYAPTDEHRYKVYIIDEAHMLTREAWNALLKILEEPPPRVIFVFATTEPQKIQQTAAPILSRCQRFDFRRISTKGIVDRLRIVLRGEGIEADDDALMPIARRAEGGMRDALSLLDQVLSFAEGNLTSTDVCRVLGLVGEELYLELFDILAERRYADVFHFVQRVTDEGYDLTEFYKGLADALRALLISSLEGPDNIDVRDDLRDAFAASAARFARGDLLRMLAMVAELDTEGRFRKSANPRTMLEALLLRWAFLDSTLDVETLLRAAGGESAPPLAGRAAETPRAAPQNRPPAPTPRAAPQNRPPAETPRAAPQNRPPAETPRAAPQNRSAARPPGAPASATRGMPAAAAPVASAAVPTPPPPDPAAAADAAATTAATAPTPPVPVVPDSGNAGRDAQLALSHLLESRRAPHGLGIFLKTALVVEADRDSMVLEIAPGPAFDRLTGDSADRRTLQDVMSDVLGRPVTISIRTAAPQPGRPGQRDDQPARITPERVRTERLARLAGNDARLAAAVREWDLELVD